MRTGTSTSLSGWQQGDPTPEDIAAITADIRRTAASEIERVRSGLGPEFLQHAPRSVSDVSYLNRLDELREALTEMRLPPGFQSGPKVAAKRSPKCRRRAWR